ncbi:unnamed protein product [Linum tenue]|uniref:S-protein homolog n=2 Tax=Linum tenue TaxID=586396 RepID=A0AAV0K8X8_9ROSI|nr:unnamed protein product [Linum tenue]
MNPTRVTVINMLTAKSDLTIHCKSKDDDLGEHVLPYQQSFAWNFRPNFWQTTLFFCSFAWQGSGDSHSFDIYVQRRDQSRCVDCRWAITENGPCLYKWRSSDYDVCYPFKN